MTNSRCKGTFLGILSSSAYAPGIYYFHNMNFYKMNLNIEICSNVHI